MGIVKWTEEKISCGDQIRPLIPSSAGHAEIHRMVMLSISVGNMCEASQNLNSLDQGWQFAKFRSTTCDPLSSGSERGHKRG